MHGHRPGIPHAPHGADRVSIHPGAGLYADLSTIARAIYAKDIILRLFKLRYKTAHLTPMHQCGSTQITVPAVTSGWRAGQYVYIHVPAMRKMGGIGWIENHPFTIASADGGQLILVAKKCGGWTRALYDLACESGGEKGEGTECKVLLEGPFVRHPWHRSLRTS